MANLQEVDQAVDNVRKNYPAVDLVLLHAVSSYPAPVEECNLMAIKTMAERYDLGVGWSDHTVSVGVINRAVHKYGAVAVEMHIDTDGEGFELHRALAARTGVDLEGFVAIPGRNTFTYTKPLLHRAGQPPEELSRLDLKNYTQTPDAAQAAVIAAMDRVAEGPESADAWMVMDQVDIAETGVVTEKVRERLRRLYTF
jgi:hypothetical protein